MDDGARSSDQTAAGRVVPVEGDFDFETAAGIRERLLRLLRQGDRHLVVDLARCTYVDSSGVLTLVAVARRASEMGGSVRLANPPPLLLKMLRVGRLGGILGVPGAPPPSPGQHLVPDTGVGQWEVTRIVLPAVPESCAVARRAVMEATRTTPLTEEDQADLELVTGEAVANAVRHGSPRGPQDRVTVRLIRGANAFVTTVSDRGNGFDTSQLLAKPNPLQMREGGLGLYYMRVLTDSAEFESGPHGTTVRLAKLYPSARSAG